MRLAFSVSRRLDFADAEALSRGVVPAGAWLDIASVLSFLCKGYGSCQCLRFRVGSLQLSGTTKRAQFRPVVLSR